jgi:hypothetical protein
MVQAKSLISERERRSVSPRNLVHFMFSTNQKMRKKLYPSKNRIIQNLKNVEGYLKAHKKTQILSKQTL